MQRTRRPASTRRDRGFTLIELGVVIVIIGILMTFLLVASWEGLRRGQERATQALILKLDEAMSDRFAALAQQRPTANVAHRYLALTEVPGSSGTAYIESPDRARLIAKIDYLKRELPDVFFVQDDANYPLNFAGMPFFPNTANPAPGSAEAAPYGRYLLPLGHGVQSARMAGLFTEVPGLSNTPLWYGYDGRSSVRGSQGIFGASYSAMGALTRQLGYHELGYNGADDNGNGLIDELAEGVAGDTARGQLIATRLGNHRHITARSEMLYAILVGGAGPLGSVFNADDFSEREVQDTDGDGLMEFVDAWGRPLQFYRWPFYYTTDFDQRREFVRQNFSDHALVDHYLHYMSKTEPRAQNPLDPNQLLVSPAWWVNLGGGFPGNSSQMSNRANLFQQHFFSLVDPYADEPQSVQGLLWDRSGFYKRRAYSSRFLIVSSGADRQLGVGSFGLDYSSSTQDDLPHRTYDAATRDDFAAAMILIEGQADRSNPTDRANLPGSAGTLAIGDAGQAGRMNLYQLPPETGASLGTQLTRDQWGFDDITNQTLNSPGTGVR